MGRGEKKKKVWDCAFALKRQESVTLESCSCWPAGGHTGAGGIHMHMLNYCLAAHVSKSEHVVQSRLCTCVVINKHNLDLEVMGWLGPVRRTLLRWREWMMATEVKLLTQGVKVRAVKWENSEVVCGIVCIRAEGQTLTETPRNVWVPLSWRSCFLNSRFQSPDQSARTRLKPF